MKNIVPWIVLLLVLSTFILPLSHAEEITACTEINGAGNDSGYYYLSGNISGGNQTSGMGTISCILVSVSNIRINCQGNAINANSSAGYTLDIDGGGPLTNVSIENCRITGTNSGVQQASLQYSNFTNNTIAVSGTYALGTSATGNNNYSYNVIPSGTSYYGIFHGISVGPSSFINNNISSEYGLFLNGVSDQLVVGGRYNVGFASGIELAGSSNIVIANTTATSIFGTGILINGGTGSTVDNVTISGATYGARITNTDQNVFSNLVVTGKGVSLVNSNNNIITNSTIANSTDIGISLHSGSANNITNNTIEGNDNYGIRTSENNTLILNNTFNNNADASGGNGATIKLNGSADVNITQNIINGSTGYGIIAENATSESNIWIINNTIENNSVAAVELLSQLTMLIVRNNTIKNNPIGISANISTQALNFANGTIVQNTIENSTEVAIYANHNITNVTNNTITKSGLGMIIANTTTAILNSNHYFNNTNDLLINNSATSSVNATNETFDNPNGDLANFSSIDFYHAPSSNEVFRIDWKTNDTGNPNSATSVANKYINITNISATFTINSITFNYDAADETNEANFTVFRYNLGTWTQVSTTLNTTGNKATITSITNPGVYALFEYSPQSSPQASTSGSNGDERILYQITHESECGNNTVRISANRAEEANVYVFVIQNDQTIAEGLTNENGEFRYYLNEAGQIQIRLGSSSFFGPFTLNYCQNNQTQNQTPVQERREETITNQEQRQENEIIDTQVNQTNTQQPQQIEQTQTGKNTNPAQTQNRGNEGQNAQSNTANSGFNWPLGIILVLIIIAGAGIYYLVLRKK